MKTSKEQKKNSAVRNRACDVLVGGVDSPVRAFKDIDADPIPMASGSGSRIYDYDGNDYIDYVLSFGAHILGHSHSDIVAAVKEAAEKGLAFGATNKYEVELAEILREAIPFIDKIRFVSSGTEAVMGAVRLARGITGRKKVLKFEHSYHGHADYLLAKAGSGVATLGLPGSKGVPEDFTRHTLVSDYGNYDSINGYFDKYGSDIAAVILEPVGGNFGVVYPDISFVDHLRSLARKCGTLVIFDEVITGFRFRFGSAAELLGFQPDIICLGKIIGGGLPIGAYGGNISVMNQLAPVGDVYQASTFAGNPVVMSAGIAALRALNSLKDDYGRLEKLTEYLSRRIKLAAERFGIELTVNLFGSMFSVRFGKRGCFGPFYKKLLAEGVYFVPSEFESNFVSFSHTEEDIRKTAEAAETALQSLSLIKEM